MKAIVLYKSKSGFVKKYAKWIAEALKADLFEASKVNVNKLMDYDVIVYGGGLHAAGINGLKKITNNYDKLKDKKIVVFGSGASPSTSKAISEVKNKNFSAEQQQHIQFYYLRGGVDFNKLPFIDKMLLRLLNIKIQAKAKRKIKLSSDEIGMLSAIKKPVDFTKKENINELIAYITTSSI